MALTRGRLWYTQMNFALPDTTTTQRTSQSFLWSYYRLLTTSLVGTNGPEGAPPTSSLWTVVGSSNGTTGGMDAVDRWGGGTFNASNFVRAGTGTNHSWIVLRSPAGLGPLYLCIDYDTGSDDRGEWYVSNNAFTGGSVTTRPTSTTESRWSFNDSNTVTLPSSAITAKVHMSRNSDGGFWLLTSYDGQGFFYSMHTVQKLADTKPNDLAPYFHFWAINAAGVGSNDSFYTGSFAMYGRSLNNTAQNFSQYTGFLAGGLSTANNNTLNSPNSDGTLDAVPMYEAWSNVSQIGLRGRVEDQFTLWQKVSPGTMVPSTSPFTFTCFNNTALPFSVAPQL